MSAVIAVCIVWFATIGLIGAVTVQRAGRFERLGTRRSARWPQRLGKRLAPAVDAAIDSMGRLGATAVTLLAGWSVVIILGALLGLVAHRLQPVIDEPALRWWQSHHVDGDWSFVWKRLTNVGGTGFIPIVVVVAVIALAVLHFGRRWWWAPSLLVVLGWVAEKYSQTILKSVVDRGHPPTSLGTWPSGGMARVVVVYGLILYFLVLRFAPRSARLWTLAATVVALLASIQAYARIVNLEHWVTDVVGGFLFGLMVLATIIVGHRVLVREMHPARTLERRQEAVVGR